MIAYEIYKLGEHTDHWGMRSFFRDQMLKANSDEDRAQTADAGWGEPAHADDPNTETRLDEAVKNQDIKLLAQFFEAGARLFA